MRLAKVVAIGVLLIVAGLGSAACQSAVPVKTAKLKDATKKPVNTTA